MEAEPTIVRRPAFTVVGLKLRRTSDKVPDEAPPMWERLMERAAEIQGVVNPHEAFGVIGNFDPRTRELDYLAGFEVADDSALPEGMASWRVPAQTYAVFPCTPPTLMETFEHACGTWLPRSGRRRGAGPELELYGEEFDPHDPGSRMYVCIPLE